MVDIAYDGSRFNAIDRIKNLLAQLTGKAPDHDGLARSVFYAIGFAALSDIQEAFIVKSRGGTDEAGIKWPPLSKEYLAYGRRFGKGEQASLKRAAGLGRGHSHGVNGKPGILSKAQQERWEKLYKQNLAWLAARQPLPQAKVSAAKIAWATIKKEGAKTMLEVFGNRVVDILRDTGVLFNSISPGYFDGEDYSKPTSEGGEQQIFRALMDGIVIGTNVVYARAHDEGCKKTGIPARTIFPVNVPAVWLDRWSEIGISAINIAVRRTLTEAA